MKPNVDTVADERIEVVGPVPPDLARRLKSVPPPKYPELSRLPRPGERDPITGSSRSWLIDTNENLAPKERFLFRVRQPGKPRGTVFINVSKLLEFLHRAENADTRMQSEVERELATA